MGNYEWPRPVVRRQNDKAEVANDLRRNFGLVFLAQFSPSLPSAYRMPPETNSVSPVTHDESSEAK